MVLITKDARMNASVWFLCWCYSSVFSSRIKAVNAEIQRAVIGGVFMSEYTIL